MPEDFSVEHTHDLIELAYSRQLWHLEAGDMVNLIQELASRLSEAQATVLSKEGRHQ